MINIIPMNEIIDLIANQEEKDKQPMNNKQEDVKTIEKALKAFDTWRVPKQIKLTEPIVCLDLLYTQHKASESKEKK